MYQKGTIWETCWNQNDPQNPKGVSSRDPSNPRIECTLSWAEGGGQETSKNLLGSTVFRRLKKVTKKYTNNSKKETKRVPKWTKNTKNDHQQRHRKNDQKNNITHRFINLSWHGNGKRGNKKIKQERETHRRTQTNTRQNKETQGITSKGVKARKHHSITKTPSQIISTWSRNPPNMIPKTSLKMVPKGSPKGGSR